MLLAGRGVSVVWSVYNMSHCWISSSQPRPDTTPCSLRWVATIWHGNTCNWQHSSSVRPPPPLLSRPLRPQPCRGRPRPHRDGGQPRPHRPRPGQAGSSQGWDREGLERERCNMFCQATSTPTSSTTTAAPPRPRDTELLSLFMKLKNKNYLSCFEFLKFNIFVSRQSNLSQPAAHGCTEQIIGADHITREKS